MLLAQMCETYNLYVDKMPSSYFWYISLKLLVNNVSSISYNTSFLLTYKKNISNFKYNSLIICLQTQYTPI